MGFDLNTMDTVALAENGGTLEVLHPVTGERLGISINLVGADSAKFKAARNAQIRKRIGKRGLTDPEVLDDDDARLLAACTLDWSGVEMNGQSVEFSEKAAFDLYKRFPWLREQAAAFVGDRANFLPVA